jgi:hypothetical protein|tara:strand:+ start:2337 stop:2855 length:519 start_codon:yes stop_codon:yes gene_type:complete
MPRSRHKRNHHKNIGRFAGIPTRVIEGYTFQSLRGNSVKLLVILARAYNGYNNGDLAITHATMKKWLTKNTMYSARDELYKKGFIIVNAYGGRSGAGRKLPSLYAITWQPVDDLKAKNGEIRYAHYPSPRPALDYWKTGTNPDYKTQEERNAQYKKDVAKIKKTCTNLQTSK